MPTLVEEILEDLIELPVDMQAEALDFVKFLKEKTRQNKIQPAQLIPNGSAIADLFEQATKNNLFSSIDDPVAWQHELRQDRVLPGRES